ncbi:Methyltransferase domain-containing protein [Amycolatopsis arida]|uniref:Methyltransferase domain-containing protein n=1 Tax=Amycolatopsis arida TaxID=587909 RepID=A0A1I5YF41_9PSEU|nr:class I SAM-dependent methyltransferase [Amycolatopsis arida]TDX90470.1 methyltransferase family protein [Amycolatopsis arida]SFQ42826.1 Methyltransferase domain-containing protein [Amycolatopsis arida]
MSVVHDIGYGREFEGFYDRIFRKDDYAERAAEKLAELHPGDGLRSLELGVGTGRIAIPLSARVGTVVGVDSSPEMLDQLRREIKEKDADVVPVHADIREYTDDEKYGLVVCVCATLSMLLEPDEQRAAIRRAADRLAPGGALVVETHNRGGVLAMHEGRRRTSFFVPYPEPNTGLLTYSTLSPDETLWQASHIWFEGGSSQVGTERSRLTTPEEVDGYAADAGLVRRSLVTDWLGTPYSEESTMFIAVYAYDG